MNFVEELLSQFTPVTAHDVVTQIAERWNTSNHGLTWMDFAEHPQHVRNLLLVVNFDAVCAWDGLAEFVSVCDKALFTDTVQAFRHIGFTALTDLLREIAELSAVKEYHNRHAFFLDKKTLQKIGVYERRLEELHFATATWALLERYLIAAVAECDKGGELAPGLTEP